VHEWCKNCPPERKAACPLAQGFLSDDDCRLHRTVFPKAFTTAMVVSDVSEDRDVVHTLFGWRRGAIERRSYHITGEAVPAGRAGEKPARGADSPIEDKPRGGNP
jgi:hypothetical protein